MTKNTKLKFDVVSSPRLTVKAKKYFHMDKKATMDFTKVDLVTRLAFVESDSQTLLTEMNLGIILFNHGLFIDVPNLNLYGDVNDTKTKNWSYIYSGI